MPVGTVGAVMHITSGTMTSVLDTLERNGYVERVADPDDRRRVLVDVTPAAQAVLDRLLPEVVQTVTATLAGIPADELEGFLVHVGRGTRRDRRRARRSRDPALRHPPPELRRT